MRRILIAVGIVVVSAVVPATAPGQDNPAGCKENGQAVASSAHALQPFGQLVRQNVPINDDVALFKTILCAP